MTSVPSVWAMTTSNLPKLLRIRAADGGAVLLLSVEYDGETGPERRELSVFAARLEKMPETGLISHELLEMLCREDAMYHAMSAGMRALSAGDVSGANLTWRLSHKGIPRAVAREAVRDLAQKGYLDEERGALRETEKGLAKLWGERRILAELRAKGYGDAALSAARERLSCEDGVARCRQLLQKRRMVAPADDRRAADKLIAALMRYGYTAAQIRTALQIEIEDE